MSRSKTFAELASQDVSKTEFNKLDGVTASTDELNALDISVASGASATTFLRGDATWQTAGSTSATDLTSGTLPAARLPAGTVLQTKMIRYDTPIALATGLPGTALTGVRLTITPVSENSVLFMQWTISGETGHDVGGWRIYKNASAITTTGYEGQAAYGSLSQWDVMAIINFGYDINSTPTTETFSYFDKPGSTSVVYYEPRAWQSSGTTSTRYINRPLSTAFGSEGQGSYENLVSIGIIHEIADGASTSVVL